MIQLELPIFMEIEQESGELKIEEVSTTFFINPLASLLVSEIVGTSNSCILMIDEIEHSIAVSKNSAVELLKMAYENFENKYIKKPLN